MVSTNDVMNDTVTTESHGHPGNVMSSTARRNDRDQGNRISSGPAVVCPQQQAGHMTEADQIVRSVKKGLANRGRPHMTLQYLAYDVVLAMRSIRALLKSSTPKKGAGNAGRMMHPRSRVQMVVVKGTRGTTSTPKSPGIPARRLNTSYGKRVRRPTPHTCGSGVWRLWICRHR